MQINPSKKNSDESKRSLDQIKNAFRYSATPKPFFDLMVKRVVRPVEFALLSSILEFCYQNQYSVDSFPMGATTAGRLVGESRANAQRVIDSLVRKGFLSKTKAPIGHANLYSLTIHPPQIEATQIEATDEVTRLKLRLPLASDCSGYPPQIEAQSYIQTHNIQTPPLPPAGVRGEELNSIFRRLAVEGYDANDCVMIFQACKDLGQIKDFYAYAISNLKNPTKLAGIREQIAAKNEFDQREREKYQNLKIIDQQPGPELSADERESFLRNFPGLSQYLEPT